MCFEIFDEMTDLGRKMCHISTHPLAFSTPLRTDDWFPRRIDGMTGKIQDVAVPGEFQQFKALAGEFPAV